MISNMACVLKSYFWGSITELSQQIKDEWHKGDEEWQNQTCINVLIVPINILCHNVAVFQNSFCKLENKWLLRRTKLNNGQPCAESGKFILPSRYLLIATLYIFLNWIQELTGNINVKTEILAVRAKARLQCLWWSYC